MKDLIILGKAPIKATISELKNENNEIWMCGTDKRNGGDLYFELHNIPINRKNVLYKLPNEVYMQNLPINNTICALLVYAYLLGYKNIKIIGSPLDATHEYIQQRPALAFVVGWCIAKGINVEWVNGPKNNNYGKQ